jgi:hypothetical protein
MSSGQLATEYLELHNGDHMSQPEFHRIYESWEVNAGPARALGTRGKLGRLAPAPALW